MNLFEELSGISNCNITFGGNHSFGMNFSSDDNMNFTNTNNISFSQIHFSESGTYPIEITFGDLSGNTVYYSSEDLQLLGFPYELIVEICDRRRKSLVCNVE